MTGANVRVLTQRDGVQALQDKLLALQAKLADVEAYSRGRTHTFALFTYADMNTDDM